MKKFLVPLMAVTGLLSLTAPASAGIISADIEVVMDLQYCCSPLDGTGASVSTVNGAIVSAGAELTVADRAINPSNWGGHVAVDIDDNGEGFRLFNDDGGNVFQSATVTISNIVSDMGDIINVFMNENDLFIGNPETFSTILEYTANSITFSVVINNAVAGSGDTWSITDDGFALFDITFGEASQEVSEPAMLGLLGLGLMGVGLARRRVK